MVGNKELIWFDNRSRYFFISDIDIFPDFILISISSLLKPCKTRIGLFLITDSTLNLISLVPYPLISLLGVADLMSNVNVGPCFNFENLISALDCEQDKVMMLAILKSSANLSIVGKLRSLPPLTD